MSTGEVQALLSSGAGFLEPPPLGQALVSVVQEAYVASSSTRKIDQVVARAADLDERGPTDPGPDEQVDAFRNRPLKRRYPYLQLGANVDKFGNGGREGRKARALACGGPSRATVR